MAEIPAARAFLPEMSTSEFVEFLRQRQVHIRASEGRLKINAPAGAVDNPLQGELKRRKQELLELLQHESTIPALAPLSEEQLQGRIPLTPAQQGIWLIEHFHPGNVAYNITEAFWIERNVELEILQAGVNALMARHRILRTSFHEVQGELFQVIADLVESPVGFTDLSWLSAEDSDRQCRETIRDEGRRPFDLTRAPLVRFHLYRMAEFRFVVSVNIHHIIADRVSLYIMREELITLGERIYRALNADGHEKHGGGEGSAVALPPNPIQYAEYAVWLDKLMRSKAMADQIAYWKSKLAGMPAFVELRHSFPWPEKRSVRGAIKPLTVSATAAAALRKIGAEEGASPFMTFLSVFAVLIARSSESGEQNRADFCIGSPITHRSQAVTQRMIGLFVNMLAFRCIVAPAMGFRELVRQVRATALEAYEHSDVPFQRLVRVLKPDRRQQRSPIFQVMFGYETYQPPVLDEMQMDVYPGTARYDLSLHLAESSEEALFGSIEYCTDLFSDADATKLVRDFEAIVSGLARNPEQDVWKLPLPEIDSGGGTAAQASAEARPTGSTGIFKRVSQLFPRS